MNVGLFILGVLGAAPDIFSIEESNVDNGRHECSESQGIRHREYWANQKRRVCLVRLDIQGEVLVQNPRCVVY